MGPHQTDVRDVEKDRHYLGHPFEYWVENFQDCDDEDRNLSAKALASFGERSIPCLLNALQYESYRHYALKALEWMGRPSFSAVVTLLQSSRWVLRKQGVWLARALYLEGPGFADRVLCDALKDENLEVCCEAARAFRWLAMPLTPRSITALAEAAKHDDVRLRVRAVDALHECIDSDNEEGKDCLLGALQDTDIAVRLEAAESLESVKPNSKKAHDVLKAALDDPVEAVRIVVQRLLKDIETGGAENQPEADWIITGEAK